jgi:hypothetical protein
MLKERATLRQQLITTDVKAKEVIVMVKPKRIIMSFRNDLTWHSTNRLRKMWIV